jgi:hypothetical protein
MFQLSDNVGGRVQGEGEHKLRDSVVCAGALLENSLLDLSSGLFLCAASRKFRTFSLRSFTQPGQCCDWLCLGRGDLHFFATLRRICVFTDDRVFQYLSRSLGPLNLVCDSRALCFFIASGPYALEHCTHFT